MMEMYAQTAEQLYNTAQKEKDTTKATQLYKKSAEMGYAPAQYQYAKRLCNPYALSWSKEAKEMYNNAAKQHYIPAVIDVTGHAIACMNYFKAIFVHNRHLFYYRSRLDTNNIQTYFDLCDLHKASHGGGKWNSFWGRKWVEKSGNFAKTAEDFYCVGLYSKEFRKRSYEHRNDGYDYFVKAADLGDGRACFEVIKANQSYSGSEWKNKELVAQKKANVVKYSEIGIAYYKKLAPTSNEAMYKLGLMYIYAEKDKEAFNSFYKAAQKGYAPSYTSVAGCYYRGDGTKKDYAKAKIWCEKALANNELTNSEKSSAYSLIGRIYENGGYGIKKNEELALQYYNKCCNAEYKRLLYELHPEQKAIDEAKAAAAREQREALRRDNLSLLGDVVNLTGQVVETVNSVKALSDGSAFSNSGNSSTTASASAPSAASSSSSSSNASADNSNGNNNNTTKKPKTTRKEDFDYEHHDEPLAAHFTRRDIMCDWCTNRVCNTCHGDGKCHKCDGYFVDEDGNKYGADGSWERYLKSKLCNQCDGVGKIDNRDCPYCKIYKTPNGSKVGITGSLTPMNLLCMDCKGTMKCAGVTCDNGKCNAYCHTKADEYNGKVDAYRKKLRGN